MSELPYFSLIVARDAVSGGIGYKNKLPWDIKEDREEFKHITTSNSSGKENIVIMGKNTWDIIGKPLPNRVNIIVSSSLTVDQSNVYVEPNLVCALKKAQSLGIDRNIFVIGEKRLYEEALYNNMLESIYITEVEVHHPSEVMSDVYFNRRPPYRFYVHSHRVVKGEQYSLTFLKYVYNRTSDEMEYTSLLRSVMENGEERSDRTNTGTLSLFGPQIEFDISNSFPLLTTKRVSLRLVFEELIWFLRGQTQNKILNDKNVHIWDGNSSAEYKEKVGLSHYPEGELGPIYGAQWRNFGGDHDLSKERHIANGVDGGVDQIADVIHQLKTNPTSRRIVVSAWNPKALKDMALPPCHMIWQFYVRTPKNSNTKYLDCKLTIRSNDLFLGAPFNIASYSLLTYMVASMTGYTPGKLIYSIGDAHIYSNHLDQVKEQLTRPVRSFPRLTVKTTHDTIEDFEFSDFVLEGYNPHPPIKGDMAV